MPEQLSLPGLDATAPPFRPETISSRGGTLRGYTLFLAIFPDSDDALRLARAASDLRSQHELNGTLLLPARLHITLHTLARFVDTIPRAVVEAAIVASAGVVCSPFPIVFDHVSSFADNNAFAFRCNARSEAAIARLRQSLALGLRRAGLHPEPSRTPHMTMLYDAHHTTRHPIEPVGWAATRFALVVSHVGLGHHQWIGQWALADRL